MGQKNSNQKAFIWVRQNKGNDSRCIYFEGKNPSVLTGEILAITANAIFEMPRKDEEKTDFSMWNRIWENLFESYCRK